MLELDEDVDHSLLINVPKQCGILSSADSDEPLQPPFKLRNSK